MRTLLAAGAAIVSLAGLSSSPVQAADIYYPPPNYSVAPPVYEPPLPPAYRPAPSYGYYAPPAYVSPPAYVAPPAYVPPVVYAPPPVYAPPVVYAPPPVYAPAPRVYGPPPVVAYGDDEEVVVAPRRDRDYADYPRYRDCWWEWGERRCGPRRGW